MTKKAAEMNHKFRVEMAESLFQPRYNVAPTQTMPVVVSEEGSIREVRWMRWGLIPVWAKDERVGNRMINARAETVAEKSTFKRCLERRRCLVPADGFYEWQKEGNRKQPMRFVVDGGEVFAFAGLWDRWKPNDREEPLESYTIITTHANKTVEPIHHRMPVILGEQDYDRWLDPEVRDLSALQKCLVPLDDSRLSYYRVSPKMNSPSVDEPSVVEEVGG